MYSASMPEATNAPTTDPAEVPTIRSASPARQPVSDSSASSPPMSHEAPTTPPAPSTNPTLMFVALPPVATVEPDRRSAVSALETPGGFLQRLTRLAGDAPDEAAGGHVGRQAVGLP